MELIDTHCHLFLDPLAQRIPQALERAEAASVTRIIVPAFDLPSWRRVQPLQQHSGLFVALGLHPWVAHQDLDPLELAEQLTRSTAVAVGEIGLDSIVPDPPLDRQLIILRQQLEVAAELQLPVILHCRGAFAELLGLLQAFAPRLQGVLHAYSKGRELAERFLALGYFVAFGGAITRPRATRAQQSAASLPLERILLETDAPSIGLDGVEPHEVEPCHVAEIAQHLAKLRGESLLTIAQRTTQNARELFQLQ